MGPRQFRASLEQPARQTMRTRGQETLRIQGGELEDAQTHLVLVCAY